MLFAYVGTFTTAHREARGEGITVYRVDPASGAFAHVQTLEAGANPSYLALRRDQRVLYAVHGDEVFVTSYGIDPASGRLAPFNRAECGGANGVRQAIDATGRWQVVANYATGTVAVLEIRADGSLADQHQLVPLEGPHGPHPTQQTSAHPHDTVLDPTGVFVAVPDKGLDRTFTFRLDAATGRLSQTGVMLAQAGAGPRHMAFHPSAPVAWVLNELDSSITTCL
jgi:6-phosphogluconolactonase (cycloisomerase 2 family)